MHVVNNLIYDLYRGPINRCLVMICRYESFCGTCKQCRGFGLKITGFGSKKIFQIHNTACKDNFKQVTIEERSLLPVGSVVLINLFSSPLMLTSTAS